MPPSGYRYYTRRWLNRPGYHAGAYILGYVAELNNYGQITIADCNRLIRLDFLAEKPDERKNALHKADVLIHTLTEMRGELTAGVLRPS